MQTRIYVTLTVSPSRVPYLLRTAHQKNQQPNKAHIPANWPTIMLSLSAMSFIYEPRLLAAQMMRANPARKANMNAGIPSASGQVMDSLNRR
jgi:hypothetical protein